MRRNKLVMPKINTKVSREIISCSLKHLERYENLVCIFSKLIRSCSKTFKSKGFMQRHMKKKEYHVLVPYFWTFLSLILSTFYTPVYPSFSIYFSVYSLYLTVINLSNLFFLSLTIWGCEDFNTPCNQKKKKCIFAYMKLALLWSQDKF